MADGFIIIESAIETDGLVKGSKELEAACRRTAARVSDMGTKTALSVTKAVHAIEQQNAAYRRQEAKVEDLRRKIAEMNETKVETAAFQSIEKELAKLGEDMAKAEEKKRQFLAAGGSEESPAFQRMEQQTASLAAQFDDALERKNALLAGGGAYTTADATGLSSLLTDAEAKLASMSNRLDDSYSGLQQQVTSLSESHVTLGQRISVAAGSMNKGIMTMLKYGLSIRSAYMLVRKMWSVLKSGLQEYAKSDAATAASINALKSSLTGLKGSLVAAFAPIANVVIPILSQFVGWLSSALNAVAAFFAVLGGSTTYKKAVVGATGAADAISGVGAAAEEAKKQLSGLDEMNIFQEDSSSGGGGGGGGGSSGGGLTWEDVPVDVSSFAGQLAITMNDVLFDWSDLTGEQIAEKIISGLGILAGAVIGFSIGGVPGAIVGSLAGLVFTLVMNSMIFDHDGKLSENELGALLASVLSAFVGGVIGFAVGGPGGALLGASIGFGVTLTLAALDFEAKYNAWAEKANEWFAGLQENVDDYFQNLSWSESFSEKMRALFEQDENGKTDVQYAIDDWWERTKEGINTSWVNFENWFISIWNGLVDKLAENKWVVKLADFLNFDIEDLKLDPIEVPATANVEHATDNIPASERTTTNWTAEHSKATRKWNPNLNWTTTAWTAEHWYASRDWRKNANWITTGWTAQHSLISRGWLSNIDWSTYGWTAKMAYVNTSSLTSTQKTLNMTAKIVSTTGSFSITAQTKAAGGVFKNGGWLPIQQFASGGTPYGGQVFIAREAGPELVGTLGGHTAVMNNDQIVASVAAGVARAIASIKFYSTSNYGAQLAQIQARLDAISAMLPTFNFPIPMPVVASGTVVPPLAGQASGEAEALRNAISSASLGGGGIAGMQSGGRKVYDVHAEVDRQTLFRVMIDEALSELMRTGQNPFALGRA